MEVGQIFKNNQGLEYKIIRIIASCKNKYRGNLYEIQFIETKSIRIVYKSSILKGEIKDYYYPNIYGVGYTGDIREFNTKFITKDDKKLLLKLKTIWRNMLSRCYNESCEDYPYYGEKGIFVAKRWHCLRTFLEDCFILKGFNKEKILSGELVLDKDILSTDIKKYSPDTCLFVSKKENHSVILYTERKFVAISPNKERIEVSGIVQFCKKYNLCITTVRNRLNSNNKKPLHGWIFLRK